MAIDIQAITNAQILVIGGGPAGSFSACLLARAGFDVVLFEASKFPRYHIGESMLPSMRTFLKLIDCDEKVVQHGFCPKPGAAVKFTQFKHEGYTDFTALGPESGAWNVIRSEFDNILLEHASSCGVKVFQQTKVTSLDFDAVTGKRPIAAHYVKTSGETGKISFDYLVDASGRMGIMSTKYLANRSMNASLKNLAHWGYWKNGSVYMPGTKRENAPFFQALTDESGWAWYIPLHDGTTSVGVVMDSKLCAEKKLELHEKATAEGRSYSLIDFYRHQLAHAPHLSELLKDATMTNSSSSEDAASTVGLVKAASDFSYSASAYAGDHFRLAGDAGAFIDPFFSSGVHLAFTSGLSAAASIASSIRSEVTETEAVKYHDAKFATSYTRFLLVVMSAYQQIRNQSVGVLSDVNEDNFDRAFDLIRPVIQGTADSNRTLVQHELQQTIDFCRHILAPTTPDIAAAARSRIDPSLLANDAPFLSPAQVDALIDQSDTDARDVLKRNQARKFMDKEMSGTSNLESEAFEGFKVRLGQMSLGLERVN